MSKRRMNKRPDPSENYLDKYLVGFNKRELDQFFHPDKFPKATFTFSALAIVLFLFLATYSPVKDKVFQALYPKPPSEAQTQNLLKISVPNTVKVGNEFKISIDLIREKAQTHNLNIVLSFPQDLLRAENINTERSFITAWEENKIDNINGKIYLKGAGDASKFTQGVDPTVALISFTAKKSGQANLGLDDSTRANVQIED